MAVRALRGAVQLEQDDRGHLVDSTRRLLKEMLDANELEQDQLISVVFSATRDLHSEFPAVAARDMGMADTPLMCVQELEVSCALPRVVRILAHADTDRPKSDVRHVYLGGAAVLRPDLAGSSGGKG